MMRTLVSIMHIWLFGIAKCLYSLPILSPQRPRIYNVKLLISIYLFLRAKLGVLPKTTMIPNDVAKTSTTDVKFFPTWLFQDIFLQNFSTKAIEITKAGTETREVTTINRIISPKFPVLIFREISNLRSLSLAWFTFLLYKIRLERRRILTSLYIRVLSPPFHVFD